MAASVASPISAQSFMPKVFYFVYNYILILLRLCIEIGRSWEWGHVWAAQISSKTSGVSWYTGR